MESFSESPPLVKQVAVALSRRCWLCVGPSRRRSHAAALLEIELLVVSLNPCEAIPLVSLNWSPIPTSCERPSPLSSIAFFTAAASSGFVQHGTGASPVMRLFQQC
jgi:hypothetical protein